ncbi:hypothetical protein [Azospirillum halopraeferens]|nr:hypothetical protein [Azospirillum halopraeferens]
MNAAVFTAFDPPPQCGALADPMPSSPDEMPATGVVEQGVA